MKVGDVVKYKRTSKPTPEDWRSVLYDRIGIVTEVSAATGRVMVSYPGLQYSPYDLLVRDLELISEA
jgi:hypothetical protein